MNRQKGPSPGKPIRVLIVDDMKTNRQLLFYILSKEGFQVEEATEGNQAVELFQSWAPHIILMDHLMPVMDGLEATKKIRELPGGKEVIILMITANVTAENESASHEAGADGFIRKPFRKAALLEGIAQHLPPSS
jgi:CheY-like chemotaxis protein